MNSTVIYVFIALFVGIGIASLYPYLKDFRVSPQEKAKVQEILVDTTKDILRVATSKDKEQLVLAITNITMRKLEQENIKGFRRQDIELMGNIVVEKLKGYTKAGV
ncbi:hypothetical protein [Crassaminicella profunda]|uniref:hypothetical protein n=1 Tax=Crassaminicella profunda TaxID=1286698 RepID=UPI001CA7049C|nr:hypothetical protein [Crassaminicella profunda]QZY56728.1 hypothetical protein K7H06_07345 [Crassaminicella profunda]